jgi:hypothetical protein
LSGHDLVVGGSGMLAGLSVVLARAGRTVSVLARGRERLEALAGRAAGLTPIWCDYTDVAALDAALEGAAHASGPIDRAVCWMHETAPDGPIQVARHVRSVFCHVLGSASGDPAAPNVIEDWRARFSAFPSLDYRIAVLGFRHEGGRSRWLTDAEISVGVGAVLDGGLSFGVVGTVEPWSASP